MNIVISSLNEIKKTGTSSDLDSAKLFISKSITDIASLILNISLEGNGIYPLVALESQSLEKTDYYGFRLTSRVNTPNGKYNFKIGNLSVDDFTIESNENLIDEHEAVYIIGRQINPITTQVVAQDANSQQFTFYMKKKYDGVSFIDESKEIYADYIPIDNNDLPEGVNFLSEQLTIVTEDIIPPVGQENEWIMLQWNLSPLVTKTAGVLKFQISVIDALGDPSIYTWQTLPSSFVIYPNLAKREGMNLTPEEQSVLADLVSAVHENTQDIENLELLMGNQSDEDADNDSEILFIGGSAPIEEAK